MQRTRAITALYRFLIIITIASILLPSFNSCEKVELPIQIETGSVISFTSKSITITGKIIDLGEGISKYGHMASPDKTFVEDVKESSMSNPTDTGTFSCTIDGLIPNMQYYVRTYADGPSGMVYGNTISFTIFEAGIFTDIRDDHSYSWVKVNNQIWMAENLAYLPSVNPSAIGSISSPHYYVYDYEGYSVDTARASENYLKYGVLYNWSAAMNGAMSSDAKPSGVQGICPCGWHLPSQGEWIELIYYLGEDHLAGSRMIESGFKALQSGARGMGGGFTAGLAWWSATEDPTHDYTTAYIIKMYTMSYVDHIDHLIQYIDYEKSFGWAIRCVKDN